MLIVASAAISIYQNLVRKIEIGLFTTNECPFVMTKRAWLEDCRVKGMEKLCHARMGNEKG